MIQRNVNEGYSDYSIQKSNMKLQSSYFANTRNDLRTEVDLCEERLLIENRLFAMQKGLNKVQKDNSILKMKSAITLGQMRLKFESIQEDNQFLIEKCFDLKKKVEVSEQSLNLKETEFAKLQSMIQEA